MKTGEPMNKNDYKKTQYNTPFLTQRADPFVCLVDGYYYFTASVPAYDRIVLRRGKTPEELRTAEEITVWEKHEKGIMSQHIWAPELHFIDGGWYLYFAAGDVDDIWAIRPYVLRCTGADPMTDPFEELGMLKAADPFSFQDFSLDMTVFAHKKQWYCIWAEKVNVGKKISNLYIARMKSPVELETAQVLLTTPDYDWERVDFWVNEGPAVLTHEGRIFVTYSASATGACYCMGLLSADADADLLDPASWKKEREPVLATCEEQGLYGPGHNSFVKDVDGRTDLMFYHARPYDEIIGDPLYDPNRHTYRMRVVWSEENWPVFAFENNF